MNVGHIRSFQKKDIKNDFSTIPHVDVVSLCAMCPVSQGSGSVLVNDDDEHRAIEQRSIEHRSKPEKESILLIR